MSAPIVRTRYGALKGTVVQNVEGGEYLAFNGIPYAEPPVGQLRFKVILCRDNKESGLQLAALLEFETTDGKEAAQFLRTVDAKTLTEGVVELTGGFGEFTVNVLFVPTMDDKSENPFAPQPADEMAKKGIEVPSIFGYNSHEGIVFLVASTDKTYSKIENDFDGFLDKLIVNQNITKTDDVVKRVRKFYFDEEPITPEQRDNYVQLLGDFQFVFGIRRIVENQFQKRVPFFFYKFSGPGENVFMPSNVTNSIKGTCHGDELGCIFYNRASNSKLEPDSKSRVTMEYFTRLWKNFAKTGDPTPKLDDVVTKKWLPVTNERIYYLEINEDLITGVNPDQEKWLLWKSISQSA
ncbi:acetylcholinesterase [Cephus cinctus]|uniref:Acetylcholinesterase n=1 Tax=Cephus cinctus TaxID=211228 RepID=A0A1W6L186_CEPCN|nr:acetylcholinesterase [Cephus cinctus]ARN17872.1 carboxylesterase 5 [Cephus cinctus]